MDHLIKNIDKIDERAHPDSTSTLQATKTTPVEVYRSETDEIIRRFLRGQLTRDQCIVSLYDALSSALPDFTAEDWPGIRSVIMANNQVIQAKSEKRRTDRRSTPASCSPGPT